MNGQGDRNEARIMRLELQVTEIMKDNEKLDKEIGSIASKIDKVTYCLLLMLALTNPITAEIAQKYLKTAIAEPVHPAQAREHAK